MWGTASLVEWLSPGCLGINEVIIFEKETESVTNEHQIVTFFQNNLKCVGYITAEYFFFCNLNLLGVGDGESHLSNCKSCQSQSHAFN